MGKATTSLTDEVLALDRARKTGQRCWICSRPKVADELREVLDGLAKRGEVVRAITLGEWLKARHGFPNRAASVTHHLWHHEGERWGAVRG